MKKLLTISLTLMCFLAVSCKKPVDEPVNPPTPEQVVKIEGMWALTSELSMTDTYWDFDGTTLRQMKASESFLVNDGTIWHCSENDFKLDRQFSFSIKKDIMYNGKVEMGAVVLDEDAGTLTVGASRFVKVTTFSADWFSVISCEDVQADVADNSVSLTGSLSRMLPGGELRVDSELNTTVAMDGAEFSIAVELPAAEEETTHSIVLDYPGAEPKEVKIERTMSMAKIVFAEERLETDYKAKTLSMEYTMEFARPQMVIEAACNANWISNLKFENGVVTLDVTKNENAAREAVVAITLKDRNGNILNSECSFAVSQDGYIQPALTVEPMTAELGSEAQDLRINYNIGNPEDDGALEVVSNDAFMHIKEKAADHVVVSIDLNDNTEAREGTVSFIYHKAGDMMTVYADKNVTVRQAGAAVPVIKIEESAIVTDYTAKEYEIPYTIENPVEGASLVMEMESEPWMSLVGITDKAVKLRFTEHSEYGVQRRADPVLKYVNKSKVVLASLDLIVHQTMDTPQITVEEGRTFNIGWQAEDITIHYSATNERSNGRFVIEPLGSSSSAWLSVKSQSGNSAVIHAEGRIPGETQSRTGRFTIYYRVGDDDTHNFASLIETVVQEGAPGIPIVTVEDVPETDYSKKKITLCVHVTNDDPQHKGAFEVTSEEDWIKDDGSPAVWDAAHGYYLKSISIDENPKTDSRMRSSFVNVNYRLPDTDFNPASSYLVSIYQKNDPVRLSVSSNEFIHEYNDTDEHTIAVTVTNPRTGAFCFLPSQRAGRWVTNITGGKDYVSYQLTEFDGDDEFRSLDTFIEYWIDGESVAAKSVKITQKNRYAGHGFVDLGLPSGKKWANQVISNSSTNKPYYFCWADTTPHTSPSDCNGDNCKYIKKVFIGQNGDYIYNATKYCHVYYHDEDDVYYKLQPEDDPAMVHWGGTWRTPTREEFRELMNNCSYRLYSYNSGGGNYTAMAEFTGKNGNILQFPLGTFPAGDLPTIALYANLMISDDLVSTDCSQVCGGRILYTNDTSRHHIGYVNMPRYNPFLVLPIAD